MNAQISVRGHILVVDDLLQWRSVLDAVLGNDFHITAVGTYEDAVEAINTIDFDVAILDVRLQDTQRLNVDGIALLRIIREKKPNAGIVILTGHRDSVPELTFQELKKHEPFEFLDKEAFDNVKLKETVRKLIARSRELDGRVG